LAQTLAERPEARWALWCGALGGLAGAVLSLKGTLGSQGLDAVMGYVFVPLVIAACAATAGIWGAAVGHVVLQLRGKVHEPRAVLIAALVAAMALPAVVAYEFLRR
jgi:predicted branched-subunit amino acid permease